MKFCQILSNAVECCQIFQILLHHVKFCHILSNLVTSSQILPYPVKPCQILSNPAKSCQMLSNSVKSYKVLFIVIYIVCPVSSYSFSCISSPVQSYPVQSYPVQSLSLFSSSQSFKTVFSVLFHLAICNDHFCGRFEYFS